MNVQEARALVELVLEGARGLIGPEQVASKRRLEEAAPALRDATAALVAAGAAGDALRMLGSLRIFFQDSGRVDEGRAMLRTALDAAAGSTPSTELARAILAEAELAFRQGDLDVARTGGERAIAMARDLGDHVTHALAVLHMSRFSYRENDAAGVRARAQEATALAPDDRLVRRAATHMLAMAAYMEGDADGALEMFGEGLAVRRAMGDRLGSAVELANIADLLVEHGRTGEAAAPLMEALEIAVDLDSMYLLPALFQTFAALAAERRSWGSVARMLGASTAAYERAGLTPDPAAQGFAETTALAAREALGAPAFDAAYAEGGAMGIDAASAEGRRIAEA